MATIYQTISGESARQHQETARTINHAIVVEKIENSDLPALSKCSGQSNFTSEMWAEDLETLERWIKEWSYYPDKIKIKVIN